MAYFNGDMHGWNDPLTGQYDPGKAHTHTYCDKCAETEIPLPKKEAWKDRPGGRHWDTGFKWAPRWGGPCDKCGKDC